MIYWSTENSFPPLIPTGETPLQSRFEDCMMVAEWLAVPAATTTSALPMLNLSGVFSNPFSDERAIQNAIRKIKNNSDFFAGECVDLIQKAADWSISFAAGSSEKKRAFLEEIAQGKGKDFLQEVLDSYKSSSGNADMRGKCGYPIGSSEYLDRMERVVFRQDVPTMSSARWGNPDYDGLLRDALESIAHQLERDLERNERENNYITDETERNLKTAVSELERCGISTGSASSKIEKLAWFVGGDPAKIRELQSKLNQLGVDEHLTEDGVYGKKTDGAVGSFMKQLLRGSVPTLAWIDPLQGSITGLTVKKIEPKGSRYANGSKYFSIRDLSSRSRNKGEITVFRADIPDDKTPYFHINTVEGRSLAKEQYVPDTEFQHRNINALNHTEISEDTYRVLKDFDGVAKKVRIAGRVLLVAGAALDALELYQTIEDDLHDADGKIGKKTYADAASIGGSWTLGALGAQGGAMLGAEIGTAILPGIGTAVGAAAVGLILGIVGSHYGDKLGNYIVDITVTEG
jgi:hypothetical protein